VAGLCHLAGRDNTAIDCLGSQGATTRPRMKGTRVISVNSASPMRAVYCSETSQTGADAITQH